ETVYGLGADATSGEAVAGIYAAKLRPSFNPLIAHAATLADAREQGVFDDHALRLGEAFWPGPLTLVVPAAPCCTVSDLARAGLPSVALRVPAHPVAQAILKAFGKPVAAPSANRSGRLSPTTAAHVIEELDGKCDMVVDGGAAQVGLESTIVACLGGPPVILRPGGIASEAIVRFCPGLRRFPDSTQVAGGTGEGEAPLAPGMLASHYAPRARLRLNAVTVEPGEAVLDFAGVLAPHVPQGAKRIDLSPAGDLRAAAASLFASLRALDATGCEVIAAAPVPASGLGEAINDRLARAAADR
ncbi:MAG: threonylcarbamoyl-AMP synthase, partial [Alphaproteobacteria bacterium]|nr:threonylcarbamoyl-AMP synthase [Alphaproteobacteria bacterium]